MIYFCLQEICDDGDGIMDLKFKSRDTFYICGYFAETSLDTCNKDLSELWHEFEAGKEELYQVFGHRNDFYGLMWYTENHRYCYLIGIKADNVNAAPAGVLCKRVPGTDYAIACVPPAMSAVDAWTEYFEKILPKAGYIPNAGHGLNFEYYPEGSGGAYELWTPVIKGD